MGIQRTNQTIGKNVLIRTIIAEFRMPKGQLKMRFMIKCKFEQTVTAVKL